MSLSKELQIGKAGEHFVCFDLIKDGYNAFLADQGLPYDVLIDLDGEIQRIQVKTCSMAGNYGKSKNVYRFSLRSAKGGNRAIRAGKVDVVAFVFLDIKIAQYVFSNETTNNKGDLKQCIDFRLEGKTKYVIGNHSFSKEKV